MKPLFFIILTGLGILVVLQAHALVSPVSDSDDAPVNAPGAASTPADLPGVRHPEADPARLPLDGALPQATARLNPVIEQVTRRNLFKVETDGTMRKAPALRRHLEKTTLKLTLWGTATRRNGEQGWAVIEDMNTKKQDLYQINDRIQGATIRSILRNKVILTLNGRDQVLEVSPDRVPSRPDRRHTVPDIPSDKSANRHPGILSMPPPRALQQRTPGKVGTERQLHAEMLDDADKSRPSFKSRPYFKNGQAAGVMLYSIRKDALARRAGLRNGDIILSVDDLDITDPGDLDTLEDLNDDAHPDSDMTLSILRHGKVRELVFNRQENTYTINDPEP